MSAQPHFSRLQARAAGRDWTLLRPADLDSLWEGMTQDEFAWDERIPYWVELWPASLALADWLLKQRGAINGRLCLDLGCGLGLSALTASSLGARVLAMDYVKDALAFARMNAAANGTPQPWWIAADWRAPVFKAQSFAFIWGGDVMYERRFAGPVLDCLEYALAPGG
jgi:predicted nicotinamide N-methyase